MRETGTAFLLKGDYAAAQRISEQLKNQFPNDAVGYTFNLNSLVGRLAWDINDTRYDAEILEDAEVALQLCKARIASYPEEPSGHYLCGQTHFALTYLHAARGNYFRAGTHGAGTIERLENALLLAPDLVDAKMHLGAAYYFADNLPPFVRAFSSLLWFIPTGNSEKSLPYLEEVTRSGTVFPDVAKYMYSSLLLNSDENAQRKAGSILADLVQRYPESRRFQLRYIAYLVEQAEYATAIEAADEFMRQEPCCRRDPVDLELARLWKVRAYIGQNKVQSAASEKAQIPPTMVSSFPYWGRGWYALTSGQINDLLDMREQAVREYRRVLALKGKGYVSDGLGDAARIGLKQAFTIRPD